MSPIIYMTAAPAFPMFDIMPDLFGPRLRPDEINWRWRNQRQIRKNRRRAHAAGKRQAFA
jgi:hypothetical protein